jgi:phosphoglucosamine mutase
MGLFGSSGIRGLVGDLITPELCIRIGAAVGSKYDEVILGMDTRTSGEMVARGLIAGLCSAGANVSYGGVMPTPTLARAAKGYDAGLMVTASHNPPEYNGVKMWNPDGSAFDQSQMDEVEAMIAGEARRMPWDGIGSLGKVNGCLDAHMESVLASLSGDCDCVIDCASGPTSLITPMLLRRMGCRVLSLNAQTDGHFPGRMPEPTEENVGDLIAMVKERGSDIGLAHDGDGDRVVAVDDRGRYLGGDVLLALFTQRLRPRALVAPIDSSMVLEEMVGKVIKTRVGDVYVSEALRKEGLPFGGEPSGTFIFSDETLCPDGVYAAALLARIASESSIAEAVDSLPSYPMDRASFRFEGRRREEVMAKLADEMEGVDCDRLIDVDGYRAEYDDGWFLIRLSGTEPKIRVTAEARSEIALNGLMRAADSVVTRCLP